MLRRIQRRIKEGQEMRRLIHHIKTQCIFTITKVYFKSNFYDNNNSKYRTDSITGNEASLSVLVSTGRITVSKNLPGELMVYSQASLIKILAWWLLQGFRWPKRNYSTSFPMLQLTADLYGLRRVESKTRTLVHCLTDTLRALG